MSARSDLALDPAPTIPDLSKLSGQALEDAAASNKPNPGKGGHKTPKAGDDPRDPATVHLNSGSWLLFFTDSAGNLYQQLNPGTALDPYWQSGNVIASSTVSDPDVVRLDSGSTSTLGLFYLRSVSGTNQVVERTSTTNGASWSAEVQLTSATTSLYHLRSIVVSGTVYLFWSDTSGALTYATSSDLASWSASSAVGHTVGALVTNSMPTFDIAHLANGNWMLAYMRPTPECYSDPNAFPVVVTVTGSSLASWGSGVDHNACVGGRWPAAMSLLQASSGTIYLAYVRYAYPWANYVNYQTGSSDGSTWTSDTLFGCDWSIGCDGGHGIDSTNPYLYVDERGHIQALWEMYTWSPAGVPDPYPNQLFQADLTANTFYKPLPPYMDPSVNYGAPSVGSGLVNVASGNLVLSQSDYKLGGLGLPTTITRTYNGGDNRDGIFGFGWSFPYAMGLQQNADGSVTIENFDGRRDYYTVSGSAYTAPPGLETTLTHNTLNGTWTVAYRDHTTKTFDSTGKLTGLTDADGNTTILAYTSGRLSTITDAAGRVFTFGYDGNGRVTSIAIPLSRSLGYGYDANGNLTSFTDAAGAVTTYGYGSDHMLTSVTDSSGRTTTIGWATLRRIKTVTDPSGATTTYAYGNQGSTGGSTTVTDARGTVTTHTYDARGRQTTIDVTMPGTGNDLVTSFAYNGDDQVASQTDPRGIVTTYQYDTQGNVTQQVVDAGTGKLNLTTSSVYTNNDLTQVTDPRGTITTFAYTSTHHLQTKTVQLDGGVTLVTSYTYYANGLLHTTKDPNGQTSGNVSTVTYDANGYPATTTNAAGDTGTTQYDAGGRLTWSKDGRLKQTSYTYDNDDRKLTVTDPLGHVTSYTYSPDGERTSLTDANGIASTTSYSRSGEVVASSADTGTTGFAVANPGFELGPTGWTAAGTPSIVTTPVLTGANAAKVDASDTYGQTIPVSAGIKYGITGYAMATGAGQTARLTYTWQNAAHATLATGNIDVAASTSGFLPVGLPPTIAPATSAFLVIILTSTTAGAWVEFDDVAPTFSSITDYDAVGNKTSVMDANGHITRYAYDAASRLTSATDARGKTTSYTLDKDGNITRTTNPLSVNVDGAFDNANRKISATVDPGGLALVTSQTYDADGNVATTTDPDHHTTTFTYDRANRLTTVLDAASGTTSYAYDANGNRTSVTDARSKVTSSTYDPVNRLLTNKDALNQVTTSGYDHAGNMTSRLDANGVTTTYGFDDAERLSSVTYSSGGSVSYTYDNIGHQKTMVDGTGTTSWIYDDFGRVTQVAAPSRPAVTYTYDAVGNRASVTEAGKTTSYTYNEINALASVTDWASRTTSYSYDNAEQPAGITYPNTISARYNVDNAGRVSSLTYAKSGTSIATYAYTFNGEGQRLTEASPEGSTTYAYDNLGRLTSASYPGSTSDSFGYDAVGNRTSLTNNGTATAFTYDSANQLSSATTGSTTTTYAYDHNGNRTSVTTGSGPADTTPPTAPGTPSATATAAEKVTLNWTAATDNVGVTSYLVYRGGTLVGMVSGASLTFTDVSTAPVASYSYTVAAVDAAGNIGPQSGTGSATTPGTGASIVAADRFGRTVSGGWGTADAGGAWTGTDATFSVNGSQGVITLTGGSSKNATLGTASGANVDLTTKIGVDQIATTSATNVGYFLRRQSTSLWYKVNVLFNTDASITLTFTRDSGGTTTTIGSATVPGLTQSTTATYDLHVRISGTTSTTAQARLWTDGTSEPSTWTLTSTDSATPSGLQGTGGTGISFLASRALHAYFDDLIVRPIDTTAPTVPTALSGTPASALINLSWTGSTDNLALAGYNVYRDGTKVNTVPVGSTSYADTGLAGGVSHAYTIKAVDWSGNESAASSPWSGAATSGALTTTYTYDKENRLTSVVTGGQTLGTYAYDGAGDRVSKTTAAGTVAYTLDLASSLPQVIAETAGSAVTTYALGKGALELDQSGTTYWYQDDTLGSARMLTDATGNASSTYNYSAFGATRSGTGSVSNEVRFDGERTDSESGLEYLRARTYDPATGLFLQRDTIAITPTDGQSVDAYAFTENSPVNLTDPSGHDPWWQDDPGYQSRGATGPSGTPTSPPVANPKASSQPTRPAPTATAGPSHGPVINVSSPVQTVSQYVASLEDFLWRYLDKWANSPESVRWAAQHGLAISQVVDWLDHARQADGILKGLGYALNYIDVIGGIGQCLQGTPWCDLGDIGNNALLDSWDLGVGAVGTLACAWLGPFSVGCGLVASYLLDPRTGTVASYLLSPPKNVVAIPGPYQNCTAPITAAEVKSGTCSPG